MSFSLLLYSDYLILALSLPFEGDLCCLVGLDRFV